MKAIEKQDLKLIPFPQKISISGGFLKGKPCVTKPMGAIGNFLSEHGDIEVQFLQNHEKKEEEYELLIAEDKIEISASSYAGFLYGAITLIMR